MSSVCHVCMARIFKLVSFWELLLLLVPSGRWLLPFLASGVSDSDVRADGVNCSSERQREAVVATRLRAEDNLPK